MRIAHWCSIIANSLNFTILSFHQEGAQLNIIYILSALEQQGTVCVCVGGGVEPESQRHPGVMVHNQGYEPQKPMSTWLSLERIQA